MIRFRMFQKRKRIITLIFVAALAIILNGCGKAQRPESGSPAVVPQNTAEVQTPEKNVAAARQDGERFEDVIILEGMEEKVQYEHVRNSTIGFEMDYDYERFVRHSDGDREYFVSCWDDPAHPENYLEVKYNPRDAWTIAASISALLSNTYEIGRNDEFALENAGNCIRIDASADVGSLTMPDQLQMVYIIPAEDGCRIVTAHYAAVGSEGFGRRFRYFMNSFIAIAAQGEKLLTEQQAVSAIQNYCLIQNPGLAESVKAGEYPIYWDNASNDGRELVVVFRSYTGALSRYHVDPFSGETYVTELVPGIMDEEQRTDEKLNAWDYLT